MVGGMTEAAPELATAALIDALLAARRAVAAVTFDLDPRDARERRLRRDRLAADLAGHAVRVEGLGAPLLVVLGGVTGAGKSTFLNTIVGRDIAATGPVRPTTQAPTLVCHPSDAGAFISTRVLPRLARAESADQGVPPEEGGTVLRLVRSGTIPPGLAVLDAPDIDSVATANRELADELLDAADVWVWFTTAGKYADASSMRYLRRARGRATAIAVALTLVHHGDGEAIAADFGRKLAAEGLRDVPLFTIPVTAVFGDRLPPGVASDLREWLHRLAGPGPRRQMRLQTLHGALAVLPAEIEALAEAADDERRVADGLRGDLDRAFRDARARFERTLDDGLPLRHEVVARWDRFVGAGRALKATSGAAGQARTWLRNLLGGDDDRLQREVRVEVADRVTRELGQLVDVAAADVIGAWSTQAAGRALVATARPRRADDFDERATTAVRGWQAAVSDRVASVGASRRTQARVVSSLLSVGATSAILVSLASAGITGAEAGIAAAAGAANHGLLTKILGEANLRALVRDARRDLLARADTLFGDERRRFARPLAEAVVDPRAVSDVRDAAEGLAAARSRGIPLHSDVGQ